ncbi:MAG: DUF2024 family protein [Bacteroidetes bacterium]|nr:MAG: DUF2024 family protein [Bacteroidota bacterium]
MKIAVYDTYVTKKDGNVMHFDIIVPTTINDPSVIYNYGKEYLKSKGLKDVSLSSRECKFCHIENLKHEWETHIKQKGYYIYEIENCN